jgi:membrane protease YdiL (CAAX protease family)
LKSFSCLIFILWTCTSFALEDAKADEKFYRPSRNLGLASSDLTLPLISFLFPGTGQIITGQYEYGVVYSTIAISGLVVSTSEAARIRHITDDKDTVTTKNNSLRKYQLGLQTYQTMGGFSLFQSFRTSVKIRQESGGQYVFIKNEETPLDIASAPFKLSFLQKTSTWIPISLGVALNLWILHHPDKGWGRTALTANDAGFAAAFSWNAGTHEEAVFRGWMMPVFRENWMNDHWSNLAQASTFAAAHLSTNDFPIIQFFLGLHLGCVTQSNGWSIGESVFIHTWWDIIAFLGAYQLKKDNPDHAPPAKLMLPPLTLSF